MASIKSTNILTDTEKDYYRSIRMIASVKQPYISDAIFRLIPVSSPGLKTMAVDKNWRIYIDFEYMIEKGRDYGAATLAHEPWHLLRDHWRRAEEIGASGNHWNHAGDLEINDDILTLIADDFLLPGKGMYSHLKSGLSAEEYYYQINPDNVPDEEPQEEQSKEDNNDTSDADSESQDNSNDIKTDTLPAGKCGSGSGGNPASYELPVDNDTEMVTEAEERLIKAQVAESIKLASTDPASQISDSMMLWAEEILKHDDVNWRKVLNSVIRNSIRYTLGQKDYAKNIPNRRQPIKGILLPAMRAPKPRIAIGIDTSYSNIEKLGIVTSEINTMLNKAGVKGRDLLAFSVDTNIEGEPAYISNIKDIKYSGAGGTDMNKAFDYVSNKLSKNIDIFILMTDGEFYSWYEKKPEKSGRVIFITCIIVDSKKEPTVTKRVIKEAESKLGWTKLVIVDLANE